jgi:hypothetical protein
VAGRFAAAVAVALAGTAVAGTSSDAASRAPLYTRAATRACLVALPNAVPGLPPATPPVPSALFVYALKRDALSTAGPAPLAHTQLGAWYGQRKYAGIILSFFRSVPAARSSLKSLAQLYGGKRVRNVVVTWDQSTVPSRSLRNRVIGCLRSDFAGKPPVVRTPRATLATFAGRWGGHTRGLSITSKARGTETANDGCCTRVYELRLEILSVTGSLTRATALYRVTAFKRYESGVRRLHVGDTGKLVLKDGIVTNTRTDDFFCSDPAWGATAACGA